LIAILAVVALFLGICMAEAKALNKMISSPIGIMISTKKQFHPLGENQRQLNLSLTNQTLCECKTGAECADLGFKYVTGKDVKQDDFKALKFYQKACDLNNGTGATTAII
jgi:TPR repeat protein